MNKKKVKKIAIVLAVILLPLIYSITYLGGFWDPYNNLNNIKVAVVNEDKCSANCKSTELVNKLKDSDTFNFIMKDKDEAEKLLMNKKYYATITIPSDFTESFEGAFSKDRKAPVIVYRTNKKTNYIASQLIENAVIRIEKELDNEVAGEVTKALSNKLNDVPEQTVKIGAALGQIYNGTVTLNSGVSKLYSGTNDLNDNSKKIVMALDKLNNGVSDINAGTDDLSKGTEVLREGSQKLQKGISGIKDQVSLANQSLSNEKVVLEDGLSQISTGSESLKNGISDYDINSKQILDGIKAYFADLRDSSTDEATITKASTYIAYIEALETKTGDLVNGSSSLDGGIDSLVSQLIPALNGISSNMGALENGLNELNNGAIGLNNGFNSLSNGMNRLDSGVKTLFTGSTELASNYKLFDNGVNVLNSSVLSLNTGTEALKNGVSDAHVKVQEATLDAKDKLSNLEGIEKYTKKPVMIKDNSYGNVDDYGTFFSPFFMSLSLWLGGILIIMGLYYDPEHRFDILDKDSTNRSKRIMYYGLIGLAQSVVLPTVLVVCLHFSVTNWFLFFGSCILIGLSFLSIMLFMVFNFDDIGKFLSVVLLVIQLAACAGTFPLETEPSFFGTISTFMPMTYSVELLRESFVSIDSSLLLKDVIVLGSIFLVFSALIFVTGYFQRVKDQKRENTKRSTKR